VAHEAVIRGVRRLDLAVHPPPDLVVEIDITHAVVDRELIYAAIGVPEMWHFDKKTGLTAWELSDGQWLRIEMSRSFPMIRVSELNPFLERWWTDGQRAVLISFRDWLRTLPR
jgi:Uma2 family endonuclease